MNKKINTILFILGATVFNIIVTVLSFLLLLIINARILKFLPEGAQAWSFPLIFIAAIAIAFFVYKFVLGFIIKKVDVEKYFDPLIKPRYRKKKGNEDL